VGVQTVSKSSEKKARARARKMQRERARRIWTILGTTGKRKRQISRIPLERRIISGIMISSPRKKRGKRDYQTVTTTHMRWEERKKRDRT